MEAIRDDQQIIRNEKSEKTQKIVRSRYKLVRRTSGQDTERIDLSQRIECVEVSVNATKKADQVGLDIAANPRIVIPEVVVV